MHEHLSRARNATTGSGEDRTDLLERAVNAAVEWLRHRGKALTEAALAAERLWNAIYEALTPEERRDVINAANEQYASENDD